MNDINKIREEYRSEVADNHTVWLKIRLTPGMEMLAQEMATGRRIYEQDVADRTGSPALGQINPDDIEPSPVVSPSSPASPMSPHSPGDPGNSPQVHPSITRRRSQRWMFDATGSFPTLFIEEALVAFYSNMAEFQQALADQGPDGRNKLLINITNVVSIEKVITRQSYSQNMAYPDVANGVAHQQPPFKRKPLTILEPVDIPQPTRHDQEFMFKILADGGQPPYRYSVLNPPKDLYVTEDGWVRGFVEQDQWPTSGYNEFLFLILVEDSSIPVQTAGLEFRYRLFRAS